jgi:non-specific serine/threonine protein kinase
MRYRLLETVRQYGVQRLAAQGREDRVRRDHALYFLALAESSELSAESVGEDRFDLVIPEEDNLRAAVDWAMVGDPLFSARLTVALELFWVARSPFEGERRLAALLAAITEMPPGLHAVVLRIQGGCLVIAGRFEDGNRLFERSLAEFQALGDDGAAGGLLQRMAIVANVGGDLDRARALAEESYGIAERLDNKRSRAAAVGALANIAIAEGELEAGLALLERSAALAKEAQFNWWQTNIMLELAIHNRRLGHMSEVGHWARETLRLANRIGERRCAVYALALLAGAAIESGNTRKAGILWGALEREERRGPVGQWEDERKQFAAAAAPSEPVDTYERARIEGGVMTFDEAIAHALRG